MPKNLYNVHKMCYNEENFDEAIAHANPRIPEKGTASCFLFLTGIQIALFSIDRSNFADDAHLISGGAMLVCTVQVENPKRDIFGRRLFAPDSVKSI